MKRYWLLLLVLACLLTGCSDEDTTDRKDDDGGKRTAATTAPTEDAEEQARGEMLELVAAREVTCVEDDTAFVLQAEVELPPYAELMAQVWEEAEAAAESEEDFGAKLFELTLAAATGENVTRSVSLELSPAQAAWSQEELQALAEEAAFQAELEEFCMEIVMGYAPELTWEEDEA